MTATQTASLLTKGSREIFWPLPIFSSNFFLMSAIARSSIVLPAGISALIASLGRIILPARGVLANLGITDLTSCVVVRVAASKLSFVK